MPTQPRPRRFAPAAETVLAQLVANVVELAVREGVRRDLMAEAAGLQGVDLTDANARVPYAHLVAVWQVVARAIHDPDVGLRWASAGQPRDLGLLGYVMSFSGTLGVALARAHRYCRLVHGALDVQLHPVRDSRVAVTLAESAVGRSMEDFRLGLLVTLCRQLTRSDFSPVEVSFRYPKPPGTLAHSKLFGCELHFGRRLSQVVFAERDLGRAIPRGDESLAGYLSAQADALLRSLVGGTTTRDRVRAVVWNALSGGKPTLDHVAEALGLAPRTLQRRLAEEGTSVHKEIEDVQKSVALAVLRDRHLPVEEVAFLLGYEEPSTFFRAFKRWTGTTPQQYRRTL
ncbi:MAG: AraC family transcriptional regulator [Gemmatimonadota bacterium]